MFAESEKILQQDLRVYYKESQRINMEIKINKTKTMVMAAEENKQ